MLQVSNPEYLFMIVRLAIRYFYRSLPNQPGSYLNWKLLAKDQQPPNDLGLHLG